MMMFKDSYVGSSLNSGSQSSVSENRVKLSNPVFLSLDKQLLAEFQVPADVVPSGVKFNL